MSRTRTMTWKLVLEDPQWQGLSSRTTTLLWGSALRSTWTWNLTGAQWQISHPFVTQSVQDDGAWYFACYVSLLNPRKFSRTWNFRGRGQGQGLVVWGQEQGQELEPQGRGQGLENWSSRTRTFLEDNNTVNYWLRKDVWWLRVSFQLTLTKFPRSKPAFLMHSLHRSVMAYGLLLYAFWWACTL